MKRTAIILLALGVLASASLSASLSGCGPRSRGSITHGFADTASPNDLRPPYDPNLTYKMVAFWQNRVRRDPSGGAIEWAKLAGAYLQRSRETGDIADCQRAEQAARRSLTIRDNNNGPARDQLAFSLFAQHQFVQAQKLAAVTMAKYQDDPEARLSYAEASLERGDYGNAARALQTAIVAGQTRPDPSIQAVQARLLDIDGHPVPALALLKQAQSEADANPDMPRENVAWFHMRVGDELARMGRADDAERSYKEALALYPHDFKATTGLARLAAGRQDWPNTIFWGQKAAAIVPNPEVVALVGDGYAALGKAKDAEAQYRLIAAEGTISRAQNLVYDRYRAMFNANHSRNLPEALALARREMTVRQDIYAYDTLAWALFKNSRLPQAQAAMTKALARGTQDAQLFYHAGVIAQAQGNKAKATADFAQASTLDPYFHPAAPAAEQHPFGGF